MAKFSLEELQEMCNLNLDKKHVQEVLDTIEKSEFQFQPGIVLPRERLANLYKLRLKIANENGKFASDTYMIMRK